MADAKISSFASHGAPVAADYVASVLASGPTSKRLLMSDAQDFVLNAFGGGTEIAVTGAVTATIGRMHHCTGTTADYTVTLPAAAGNTGKLIGFRMGTASALTKYVTLDGNAAETIDGATTRVMWATETAILLCDGSNWHKIAGKTVPMSAMLTRTTAQSIANVTYTKVTLATEVFDNGGIGDPTTNNRINIKRPGAYMLSVFARIDYPGSTSQFELVVGCFQNGSEIFRGANTVPSGVTINSAGAGQGYQLAASDYIELHVYQSTGVSQDTHTTIVPRLSVVEVPSW